MKDALLDGNQTPDLPATPAPRGELDDLKRQMIEMQNRLEALAKK